MAHEWMTVTQAEQYFGVSRVTLARYFDDGRLNGFRTEGTGRYRRYYKDENAARLREEFERRFAARLVRFLR